MPRYGRYLKLEKNIAASDTGGILERWRYGHLLLANDTHPNGRLKHGVTEKRVAEAKAAGYTTLSEREIQYRLQCARAYDSEAKLRNAVAEFGSWRGLIDAGFPQVELPEGADPGDPYDPRTESERQSDARAEIERLKAEHAGQGTLFDWEPRFTFRFQGDEHGPRTPLGDLAPVLDSSERFTADMAKYDAERRAYYEELVKAVGGDLTKTWYEAEMRRRGLDALGVTDMESFEQIKREFFSAYYGTPSTDEAFGLLDDDE
jgi:hypothetical protein